jgi:choline dehydrogenase-like flavoprotein
MGDDPGSSVVDRWGRSHDIPNLYVVDGSVFVTSSGTNPTSTIAALAMRTAEHMVEDRYNQKVPV